MLVSKVFHNIHHLLGLSHHVTCHVPVVSHASLSSKEKKRKRKQNPYKVRK